MTTPDTKAIRTKMEALTGFTPWPWAAERDECHFGSLSSILGGGTSHKSGLHRELMVEVGGWQGVKAQEATTRLIASAPDMHATILALCDALDARRNQVPTAPDPVARLVEAARAEAEKAMRKFPQPNYVISKVAEEAGEVVKAAIHCAEGRETPEAVRAEIVQAMAMLIRLYLEGDQVHGLPALAATETSHAS